jgi:hypothetical protein
MWITTTQRWLGKMTLVVNVFSRNARSNNDSDPGHAFPQLHSTPAELHLLAIDGCLLLPCAQLSVMARIFTFGFLGSVMLCTVLPLSSVNL